MYHSPETRDNAAMQLLVETGKLTPENLSLMLIRKHDWHDYEGAKWLLEHGADPNYQRQRGWLALHHAIARDNNLNIIELLLDHGADPKLRKDGASAVARAARRGRGDVLALFERRGIPIELRGADRLIAACARNDPTASPISSARSSRGEASSSPSSRGPGTPMASAISSISASPPRRCTKATGISTSRRTAPRCTSRPGRGSPQPCTC